MAGNASNWHKPTAGAYKGQVVYVSLAALRRDQPSAAQFMQATAAKRGQAIPAVITDALERGLIKPQARPAGAALTGGALPAGGALVRTGTPTPSAQPMDDRRAARVYASQADSLEPGDAKLGAIYTAQGFHAKPDVLPKADIDAYVAKGEIEVFRGTQSANGNPDAYGELYRSGAQHYPGYGVFGNGTYVAVGYSVGASYAGGSGKGRGSVLRMTLKADAKIAEYSALNDERYAASQAVQSSPGYQVYQQAKRQLAAQRSKLASDRSNTVDRETRAAQLEALTARYNRIQARQDREYPQPTHYDDEGAFAAARGYDAIRVRNAGKGGDYYVILNRGATRVQDESIIP